MVRPNENSTFVNLKMAVIMHNKKGYKRNIMAIFSCFAG